jgi:hypothetical protein
MATLTGVNTDAVRPALRAIGKEVQEQHSEIYRYCTGIEMDIARLTMEVTSGNRFIYTPEQLKEKNETLQAHRLKLETEKGPREKRIEELRTKIQLVENLKTRSLEDMVTITGSTIDVVYLMDQYLESGGKMIDVFTGQSHYY